MSPPLCSLDTLKHTIMFILFAAKLDQNEEMIPVEKFAGHADQILLPLNLGFTCSCSSSGVASAKQHEQPSVEDSTHAKPPVVDSEDSFHQLNKANCQEKQHQSNVDALPRPEARLRQRQKVRKEKKPAQSPSKGQVETKTLPDTEPASTSKPKKRTTRKSRQHWGWQGRKCN